MTACPSYPISLKQRELSSGACKQICHLKEIIITMQLHLKHLLHTKGDSTGQQQPVNSHYWTIAMKVSMLRRYPSGLNICKTPLRAFSISLSRMCVRV